MAVDPEEARETAREILGDRRFESDPAPRPFRGILEWIGERLEPIGRALDKVPWWVWALLAIGLVTFVVVRLLMGARLTSGSLGGGGAGTSGRAKSEDPAALEREADEAEREGDYERAVRLRFRAGLIRLGRRGAIEYSPSVTVNEVRRSLVSTDFDALATTFEEVTYGDRHAVDEDASASKRAWPRVVESSGRKSS
jgi:hypothetical protein